MSRRKKAAPFSLFAFQDIITSVTGIILLITMLMAIELVQTLSKAAAAPQEQKSTQVAQMLRQAVSENIHEIDRLRKVLDETTTIRFDADSLRLRLAAMKAAAGEMELQNEQVQATQEKIDARRAEQAQDANDLSPDAIEALVAEQAAVAQQIEAMRESNRVVFNRPAGAAKTPWLVELNVTSIVAAEIGQARPPESFETPGAFLEWVQDQDRDSRYFVLLVKPDTIDAFSAIRESLQERRFDVGYDLLPSDQTAIDAQTGAGVQ